MSSQTNRVRVRRFVMPVAALLFSVGTPSHAADAGPSMAGAYKDDRLSISLQKDNPLGNVYHGDITLGDKSYPLTAHESEGKLEGTFSDNAGDSYPFSATFESGSLTFITGDTTYHLKSNAVAEAPGQPQATSATGQPIRFRQLEVQDDPNMIGGTAFTILIPEGWKSEGGPVWQKNIVEPCVFRMRIWDPNNLSEVNAYPNIRFWWNSNRGPFSPRQGQVNFGLGLGAVTEPPVDAPTAMRQYVLPTCCKDLPADFRIISCEEDPEYAKYAQTRPVVNDLGYQPPTFTAARALLEYSENGKMVEEKVYCAVTVQTAGTLTYWSPCIISSVRAEKRQLDNVVAILTCVGRSVTLNEDWAIKAAMLRAYAVRQRTQWINQQTMSMNEFCNAQRARLTREFQTNMAASHAQYEKNMAAMDQQTESFNKVLTGVQNYTNPMTGRTMELPSNSQPVYFNSLSNTVQIGGDKPKDWTVLQPK